MMGSENTAFVNTELLVWARELAGMPTEYVASKLKFKQEKINEWEVGTSYPTINQAKKLASFYKIPFGTFFLPKPPKTDRPKQVDYRRALPFGAFEDSVKINNEIRNAMNKRELYIELLEVLETPIPHFNALINNAEDYIKVADRIRNLLNIDYTKQKTWRNDDAFNYLRASIERIGILVFQAKDIDVKIMRGMAVYNEILPVVIVNRKDDKKARCFSLIHELVHVMLKTSSLCDFSEVVSDIEVYCNKIAGECLVPRTILKQESLYRTRDKGEWKDWEIVSLAKTFSVSREVILRRLLDLGNITKTFYTDKVDAYYKEFLERKVEKKDKGKAIVLPPTDAISRHGKPFLRTVFEAYNSDILSGADVASILDIKTKHFNKIAEEVWK